MAEQRVSTAVVTFSAEDKRLYVSMLTLYKLSLMSEEGGKRFVNDWMLTLLLRSLASCPFCNHAVVTRLHGNKTHPG